MKRSRLGMLFSGVLFGTALTAQANVTGGVDPSYVNVKVYEVRLFADANCSGGGLTIYQNSNPSYQNWAVSPTIGSGAIPNGTYNCVAMKMSDFIHVRPASVSPDWTQGVCSTSGDYILDVGHDDTAIDPDGTTHTLGPRGTENIVWLYVRTGATASNGPDQHTWQPTGGIPLTSPLVVTGDQIRTMVFDFTNKVGEDQIDNTTWECGCDAPTMSFR